MPPPPSSRGGYHHGDLRNALIRAATALAREGGPQAVVLRAAARATGVSPTAAYRHFAGHGDLLHAVKHSAFDRLADYLEEGMAAHPGADGEAAAARLRALGLAYVRFALAEPGLFRTAFSEHADPQAPRYVAGAGAADDEEQRHGEVDARRDRAFGLLADVMDTLLGAGLLSSELRPGAEVSAWSVVHGAAMLLLDGPLAPLPQDQAETLTMRVVDDMLRGLLTASTAGETTGDEAVPEM